MDLGQKGNYSITSQYNMHKCTWQAEILGDIDIVSHPLPFREDLFPRYRLLCPSSFITGDADDMPMMFFLSFRREDLYATQCVSSGYRWRSPAGGRTPPRLATRSSTLSRARLIGSFVCASSASTPPVATTSAASFGANSAACWTECRPLEHTDRSGTYDLLLVVQ